jgi:hypothetical protein
MRESQNTISGVSAVGIAKSCPGAGPQTVWNPILEHVMAILQECHREEKQNHGGHNR